MTDRPIELSTEIEQHLLIWKADPYFKKMSKDLQNKVKDFIDYFNIIKNSDGTLPGFEVNKKELPERQAAKQFAMLFKKRYQETTGISYTESFTGAAFVIFATIMKRVLEAGATAEDYVNWFFDEFLQEKENKKFMPPPINLCTNNNMVQRFLYEKKDYLKQKKAKELISSKKIILNEIAMKIFSKTHSEECSVVVRKIVANDIACREAVSILYNICVVNNLNDEIKELENINLLKQDKI